MSQSSRSAQAQVTGSNTQPAPNGGVWTPLGPAPEVTGQGGSNSGRITSIAVNPQNSSDIWIGSADGGVWNSLDGGTSWVPMTDSQQTLSIGAIAIDPSNPQVIYVGTGEANFNLDGFWGDGILKSTDHGQTWTQYGSNQFTGLSIGKIIVDPSNTSILLMAVSLNDSAFTTEGTLPSQVNNAGIWRSTDGGQTWTQTLGEQTIVDQGLTNQYSLSSATDVTFDPTNVGVVYAGFSNLNGGSACPCLWKSIQNGTATSWSPVTSSVLPASDNTAIERVAFAISHDGQTFYAVFVDGNGDLYNSAIYVSDHTASMWQALPVNNVQLASDNSEHQWWYEAVIAVDPTDAQTAYLGGVDLYQTRTGGVTWSVAPGYTSAVHTDQHALTFLSATSSAFYLGNDGGIWEGYNGPFYTNLNGANGAGLNLTQLYGASVGLTGADAQIYAGSQDNTILQYPVGRSGEAQWNEMATGSANGDGGQVAVDYTNNAIVYAEQSWGELYRSSDGGASSPWSLIGGDATSSTTGVNGLNACPNNSRGTISGAACDPTNWVMPFVLAPTNHDELFAGTDKLYRSLNDGQSWSSLGSLEQLDNQSPVSALAIGPHSDSVIYVGDNNGDVFASTTGGSTWTNTNVKGANTAGGMVTGLAIDPLNAAIVYATIANFAVCGTGITACGQHIFRSTDGGQTWHDLDPAGYLPNIPFESVVVDPLNDNTIFVGTDAGIFDTSDVATPASSGGPTWYNVYGLPNVAVEQMFTDSKGTQIYVATHGRGLWRVPLVSGTLYAAQNMNDGSQTGCLQDNSLYVYGDSSLDGTRLWTYRDTGAAAGSCLEARELLLANGILYVAAGQNSTGGYNLFALDALSGRVIWQITLSDWNSMAVGNGILYVGSLFNLLALNANSGATMWSVQLAKATKKTPAPSPVTVLASTSLVYTMGSDGHLYAISASTGANVWTSQNTGYLGTPALANGIVYAGRGANGTATFLDALNPSTGALVWEQQYQVAGQAMAPTAMTIVNGVLYGGASILLGNGGDSAILAINAATGALVWSYYIGYGYTGPDNPQVGPDGLVIDNGSNLYAWQASTGALVWSKTFDPLPEPAFVMLRGDVLYTNPNSYGIYAVNPMTGATLWTEPTYGAATPYVWPAIAVTS